MFHKFSSENRNPYNTRWLKYDRDWRVCKQAASRSSCAVRLVYIQNSPGHIWTTLYNVKKYGRSGQNTDDNIIQRIRFLCWITKDTDTHSEYVILVCPWRQWFRERVAILHYTKLLCPSCFVVLLCQPSLFSAGAETNIRSSYFRYAWRHNEIKDLVSAPVGLWNECTSNPTFINYKRITIYKVGACKTNCRRTSDNN